MLAPQSWPMAIGGVGTDTRRAIVLILQRDSDGHATQMSQLQKSSQPARRLGFERQAQ
jgi:hypothetical protein